MESFNGIPYFSISNIVPAGLQMKGNQCSSVSYKYCKSDNKQQKIIY